MAEATNNNSSLEAIITPFGGGIVTDVPPQSQPKGTMRFALNAVIRSTEGDATFPSSEESNIAVTTFPAGYIPIGKVYIGDNESAIFLVNPATDFSQIGILNSKDTYTPIVTENTNTPIKARLGFKLTHQIEAIYRFRRGGEKTIYFTDNLNVPRYFNFNTPDDFKTKTGTSAYFDAKFFALQKTSNRLPKVKSLSVIEGGGTLRAGSYNFAVQYLDNDLNPTEFYLTTNVINIYHDSIKQEYNRIDGSTNIDNDALRFGPSNKSIQLELDNLDTTFPYYRVACIEANNGSGLVSNVLYSEYQSINDPTFLYDGTNANVKGTTEEVAQFTDVVKKAKSIHQLENRLLLGNTEGERKKFTKFIAEAEKIHIDFIEEQVTITNPLSETSPKNPNNSVKGYMPEENYSFGIVYVFDNGYTSPVFNIPDHKDKTKKYHTVPKLSGNLVSNSGSTSGIVYKRYSATYETKVAVGKDVKITFTMKVVKKNDPTAIIFTVEDVEITNLEETSTILRGEYYIGDSYSIPGNISDYEVMFFKKEEVTPSNPGQSEDISKTPTTNPNNTSTEDRALTENRDKNTFTGTLKEEVRQTYGNTSYMANIFKAKVTNIDLSALEDEGVIGYYIVRNERKETDRVISETGYLVRMVQRDPYIAFGLLGTSFEIPERAIRYHDKNEKPYFQYPTPEIDAYKSNKKFFAFICPENLFNQKGEFNFDELHIEEYFDFEDIKGGKSGYDDVLDGSTRQEGKAGESPNGDDNETPDKSPTSNGRDGWSFRLGARDSSLNLNSQKASTIIKREDIEDIFQLTALDSKALNQYTLYNVASDNRTVVIQFKNEIDIPFYKIAKVSLKRKIQEPYSDYRSRPYFKEHQNISSTQELTITNGDTYIGSIKYLNTMLFKFIEAYRAKFSKNLFAIIAGAFLAVAGIVGAVFTAGTSLYLAGVGLALAGVGATLAASGVKKEAIAKAYNDAYLKGLDRTVVDDLGITTHWYLNGIGYAQMPYPTYKDGSSKGGYGFGDFVQAGNTFQNIDGPGDDTIAYISDVLTDLWFQSPINIPLRNKFNNSLVPAFLPSPGFKEKLTPFFINNDSSGITGNGNVESSNYQRYPISEYELHVSNKVLLPDNNRDDKRLYSSVTLGEYYHVNPDYHRTNKEKIFFHLPIEYNDQTGNKEKFPVRIHYSQQSFQEELTDNYRSFLPNNYRDINGEMGEIVHIFSLQDNLFAHTKEAIWNLPSNHQERVTNQIVSFIGTGDFFSVPPRRVGLSLEGHNAGLQHKWSAITTPNGYYFVSENRNAIYRFAGQNVEAISALGNYDWFFKNIKIQSPSSLLDNPSHPLGTGFITVYDAEKERIIFTKKDFVVRPSQFMLEDVIARKALSYEYMSDNSWTFSFSERDKAWVSFHSYRPNMYISHPHKFYSYLFQARDNNLWKHNIKGSYQRFYDRIEPFIIEYVSIQNPLINNIYDHVTLFVEAKNYDPVTEEFISNEDIFFDNAIFYNTKQSSGELRIKVDDNKPEDFFHNQINNLTPDQILASRKEKNWNLNQLRDFVVDYSKPLFLSSNIALPLSDTYSYIDKVVNPNTVSHLKPWYELQSFRDKYLIIRFIFNNFAADTTKGGKYKMSVNYSAEDAVKTIR